MGQGVQHEIYGCDIAFAEAACNPTHDKILSLAASDDYFAAIGIEIFGHDTGIAYMPARLEAKAGEQPGR